MKTPCLGAHPGSLKKTLVVRTHNLGAPDARVPVRQQPCTGFIKSQKLQSDHLMSIKIAKLAKMYCQKRSLDITHYNPPINFRVILLATLRHVV